ncbi:putative nuclease HARBI1 [Ochlerotatus camptorhynchus]|uniref:putative nuclease HARBI1 n=1 Tax=Ochlerotatus camptorhynchus TaxID=644619 RepID=UPI0031D68AB1
MSSFELWFDSDVESDDITEEDLSSVRIERRRLRDASNPLDLPSDTFVNYFRVSKDLFNHLLNILDTKLGPTVGSASVLPIIKLAAALRFFAEGGYQKGAGNDLFVGVAQPTLSKILTKVIDVFEEHVCATVITFPTNEAEKNSIKMGFFEKTGFPGVIGCVDGTHVKIFKPRSDVQHLYYNRKGYHSLNVMVVCDHNMIIRYVDANHPGSSHDSFIWNTSSLNDMLETNFMNGERNSWILGDAGYALKPFLITPYRTSGSSQNNELKLRFNQIHSKTRWIVERSFGVLKNVFRCILGARQLHYKPEKATKIINVCCALHNLRIRFNVPLHETIPQFEADFQEEEAADDNANVTAANIRDEIMYAIFQNNR